MLNFLDEYRKLELPRDLLYRVPELKYLRVIPAYHCCADESTVMAICERGFAALSPRDSGFFGRGMYFTLDLEYAVDHYCKDGSAVVMCCDVVVGNVYPVIEDPADTVQGLLGTPADWRYDASFAAVGWDASAKRMTGGELFESPQPCRPQLAREAGRDLRSELVLFDMASILPRFVLHMRRKEEDDYAGHGRKLGQLAATVELGSRDEYEAARAENNSTVMLE